MEEIPSIAPYSGDMPNRQAQERDTFADNIFLYISWAGSTFINAFNLSASKINLTIGSINSTLNEIVGLKNEIVELKNDVVSLKNETSSLSNTIVSTIGATYGGGWNETDDFTDLITTHNGAVWVGLSSDVGNTPDYNSNWLLVNYVEDKVYINADYTANVGDIIYVDTSESKVTITLPIATKGARVRILDIEWTFDVFPCDVIDVNGILINKIDDGTVYEIDTKGASRTLEVIENKNNELEWRTI